MKKWSNKPRNTAVPVFPTSRWSQTKDNLLQRTKDWIDRRLLTEQEVVVHLFRPGPSDRQCQRFNKDLIDAHYENARPGHRITYKYVDPKDWFGPITEEEI